MPTLMKRTMRNLVAGLNGLRRRIQGPRKPTSFTRIPLPVKGRLFVSAMPYGPYDTRNGILKSYLRHRIPLVLMLVTDGELEKKARRDIRGLYEKNGIAVHRLPIADLTAPRLDELDRALPALVEHLQRGKLAVHCNAGVGRTGVIAACLTTAIMGCSGAEAIAHIREHMMTDLTDEQQRIILKWASERQA